MDAIHNVLFTACLCAMLTAAVQMFSAERMKREMRIVCGLVFILCVFTQISGNDMSLSLSGYDFINDGEYADMEQSFDETVLSETKRNIEKNIIRELEKKKIYPEKISIDCTLTEYNLIEVNKTSLFFSKAAGENVADEAENILNLILPDTDVEVIYVE